MVLVEISLAVAAVKSVSEAIHAAKTVSDIAGKLDDALNLTEKAKKNAPAKPIGKTQKNIQQKLDKYDNTDGESTNLGAIVKEYSDSKALQNELYLLGCSLNRKFGEGTWDKILDIRAKRLAKQKELEQDRKNKLKELQEERKRFWLEILKVLGLLITLTAFTMWLLQYY
jgi:hypothetical protein